jgi:hypothetical protein
MSATTEAPLPARVACAAMLMDDGLVVTGARHFSPDMRKVLLRIYGPNYHTHVSEQGFVDTQGRFLDRQTAWWHADANGQIFNLDLGRNTGERRAPNQGNAGTLYSENLY